MCEWEGRGEGFFFVDLLRMHRCVFTTVVFCSAHSPLGECHQAPEGSFRLSESQTCEFDLSTLLFPLWQKKGKSLTLGRCGEKQHPLKDEEVGILVQGFCSTAVDLYQERGNAVDVFRCLLKVYDMSRLIGQSVGFIEFIARLLSDKLVSPSASLYCTNTNCQ